MFAANSKKPSMNNNSLERQEPLLPPPPPRVCVVQADSGLVLTTDPKPRLRWTVELHDRFVDAVNQLGGPDKATPKTIMKVMSIKGLTLYHLKSHLQKFRLGKQPHNSKEFNDHTLKDAAALELQRNMGSVSAMMNRSINENLMAADAVKMQIEVRRRLHEQLEVQRHLQLRIEAEGKYMESILARACQTLGAQGMDSQGVSDFAAIKNLNYCSSIGSLPAPRDLQQVLSGSSAQVDHLQHHMMNSTSLEGFFLSDHDSLCGTAAGKKRPNPYSNPNEPNLFDNYWDLSQVSQLGLEEESPKSTSDQLEVAPSLMDTGIIGMKSSSLVDAYESKVMSSIIAKEEEDDDDDDDDYDNDYSAGRRRITKDQYYQSLIGSHGSY